jgi:benzoyl-CoA reductase/2-hydroxyglutaryl-CoA dehydratase subunit BcrC/BadD/HgdB
MQGRWARHCWQKRSLSAEEEKEVELIKELPEVFEEFAEQRKNSFLGVKKLKEQGVPVVGAYCTYFPQEIAMAMGAATVGLCSTSDETIPDAERDLPKNLCPLIKSSYGFAKTDKCPFFYFSDVVVGETTCDGKKKMYEYMSEFKDVFLMELPNTQGEEALKLWKSEIIRFKEYLEKIIQAIESNGAVVVTYENCTGAKSIDKLVDEDAEDVYDALARRYLNIGCSVMTPNPNRLELLGRLIDEYQVDGVVEMTLQACHTYNIESYGIRRFVNQEKGIPYISVETDYSQADIGQLNTRIAAFIEML